MTCPSCIVLPLAVVGISLTTKMLILGLLVTILSLTTYLHYKEFSGCAECV